MGINIAIFRTQGNPHLADIIHFRKICVEDEICRLADIHAAERIPVILIFSVMRQGDAIGFAIR